MITRLLLLPLALFATCCYLQAQGNFKPSLETVDTPTALDIDALDFRLPHAASGLPGREPALLSPSLLHLWSTRQNSNAQQLQAPLTLTGVAGIKIEKDPETGQIIALRGRPNQLAAAAADKADAYAYFSAVGHILGIDNPYTELRLSEPETDELGQVHIRISQQYAGYPIAHTDAWLHANGADGFDLFTGRLQATPNPLVDAAPSLQETAIKTIVQALEAEEYVQLPVEKMALITDQERQLSLALQWFHTRNNGLRLAYKVNSFPNLAAHYTTYVDAHTGDVLQRYSHVCKLLGPHAHEEITSGTAAHTAEHENPPLSTLPPDGPYTTNVQDLNNQLVTLNTYVLSDTYYLLDGSRPMFMGFIDSDPIGGILTIDAMGGSPQLTNFSLTIPTSNNNTDWSRTEASAHDNAATAYQYFLNRFQRNSIDNNGSTILTIINVNEPDGSEMDNAFWNGRALFYGNGNQAFIDLPKGLDVAGHEMSHGVISSTADLIYQGQPGAMNESFADIFGYLVENETGNYRIGEDVVNTNIFPSGAMRNLQNPNNGAAGPQDFRWQPAHMDDYQNLPLNADNDNGGVHINSGIPNRAFYLFSAHANVGDSRAEQVYYRALTTYLTRSSRFADLRIAVVQAASDLYGANVAQAADEAFAAVGIEGEAGEYTIDLEENQGERFLLLANTSQTALFLANENGGIIENPLEEVGLSSKPSITDDGSLAVFVDDQNRLRVYNFTTNTLGFIEANPSTNWRNIAISKDGDRIAVTTQDNDNRVLIFDFPSNQGQFFTLYNPTTANEVSTGDVLYSDALEWEPGGEFLMYDALSRLDNLEFWDIGFVRVWNNNSNEFGDGNIVKLTNSLPEGISIGNPTFSRNSPFIIAFEQVDFANEIYGILGANIETGALDTIFLNNRINYPNYGISDDRIVFDATSQNQQAILANIPLAENKISPAGIPTGIVSNGHWGIYFATGDRDLNTGIEGPIVEDQNIAIYPTAFSDQLFVEHLSEGFNQHAVQLLDISGRLVRSFVLSGTGPQALETAGLVPGTYLLVIQLEEGGLVKRVFKQ